MNQPDKDSLAKTIDVAPWDLLRSHLERGGIIVVDQALELADVAFNVASDNKVSVERWLSNSLLTKPSLEQISDWDCNRQKLFSMIVISPFVLIQETP